MINPFEFAAPNRVVFGCGRLREAGTLVRGWGSRCLVFTGGHPERASTLHQSLRKAGLLVESVTVSGEPTFDAVREYVTRAREVAPDCLVAIGGGSVIDTAKAVAMLMANGGDPLDYAEVIGRGLPITKISVPFIAIPTTAGAGAEATRNAVLVERSKKAKVSLRSHLMIPRLVIIDPETTITLSAEMTAATGMDALSQLIEPFVSLRANPATDALCREGIKRVARSIERACCLPDDLEARSDLSLAAWWSGMALANAGLGAVHGIAAALGGMCDAPHGLICAHYLAPVCEANIRTLRADPGDHAALDRYTEIAARLTGQSGAQADDGVAWLAQLAKNLPLRSLAEYGVNTLPENEVIDSAMRSNSMRGNPVALSLDEVRRVFQAGLR